MAGFRVLKLRAYSRGISKGAGSRSWSDALRPKPLSVFEFEFRCCGSHARRNDEPWQGANSTTVGGQS